MNPLSSIFKLVHIDDFIQWHFPNGKQTKIYSFLFPLNVSFESDTHIKKGTITLVDTHLVAEVI